MEDDSEGEAALMVVGATVELDSVTDDCEVEAMLVVAGPVVELSFVLDSVEDHCEVKAALLVTGSVVEPLVELDSTDDDSGVEATLVASGTVVEPLLVIDSVEDVFDVEASLVITGAMVELSLKLESVEDDGENGITAAVVSVEPIACVPVIKIKNRLFQISFNVHCDHCLRSVCVLVLPWESSDEKTAPSRGNDGRGLDCYAKGESKSIHHHTLQTPMVTGAAVAQWGKAPTAPMEGLYTLKFLVSGPCLSVLN